MQGGIYRIVGPNGKLYIGSTFSFKKRWAEHLRALKANKHSNTKLQASWNKHGAEAFKFEVVENVNEPEKLLYYEQIWLDILYQSLDANDIYNLAVSVNGGMTGRKHTDEAKARMSAKKEGYIPSTFDKLSTAESIQKMSLTKSGGKSYTIVTPDGTEYKNVTNLTAFAKKHGLLVGNLRRMLLGQSQYKGFTGNLE